MRQLLFATTNPGKLREAKTFLEKEDIAVLGLKDFPHIMLVEEAGETFEENAILKAKGYFEQTQIPCIGDDGGLMIDSLGGAPGVHSRRFLGREGTSTEFAEAILEKLNGIPKEKRTARLGGVLAFWNGKQLFISENWVDGYITDSLMDDPIEGIPYRSIFIVSGLNTLYSAMTPEEHQKISFRIKNLEQLKKDILKYI